jgi:hypothetical protein
MSSKFNYTIKSEIKRLKLMNDPEWPSEFVDINLNVWVNIGAFPYDLSFEDVIYHINRALITESICIYAIFQEGSKSWKCGIDCFPNSASNAIMKSLGFSTRRLFF